MSVTPALVLLPPVLWALVQLASLRLPLAVALGAGLTVLAGPVLGPVLMTANGKAWRTGAVLGSLATVWAVLLAHRVL